MLSSLRLSLGPVGGPHRCSTVLVGYLRQEIKCHREKYLNIQAPGSKYYHCTPSQYIQNQNAISSEQELNKSRQDILNKINQSKVDYKSLSLVNMLAVSRAALAPALGYFIFNGMYSEATVCMAYVMVSDALEKPIGRMTKQASPMYTALDSIADKLVACTGLIALYNMDILTILAIKGLIFKELVITGSAIYMRRLGLGDDSGMKQFLDINGRPTLGWRPLTCERVTRGLQYALILSHLVIPEVLRSNEYWWPLALLQGGALFSASLVLATRFLQLTYHRFLVRSPQL